METADQANAFITDAELTARLNANLRTVYEQLVAARGSGFYRTVYSFNTVAGTADYALPGAFMELLGVHITPSTNERWPLVEANDDEASVLEVATQQYPSRYQLRVGNLTLLPTPTAVVAMRLVYVPAFTALSADGDTFDGVCGFEEAAIWRTVAEMLHKDQADVSFALAKVGEWDVRIGKMAEARDATAPNRVRRRYRMRWGIL